MGAWGAGVFENDDALDWLGTFEEAVRPGSVRSALSRVADAGRGVPASEASEALAAAELVAAALGRPCRSAEAERLMSLAAQCPQLVGEQALALRAVEGIRDAARSELHQLWHEEPEGGAAWDAAVADLRKRLEAGAVASPAEQPGAKPHRFSPPGAGDVFAIPVEQRWGHGQVVYEAEMGDYYVVFEPLRDRPADDPAEVVSDPILLAAFSSDAQLFHGRWKRVGRATPADAPMPAFIEERHGAAGHEMLVVDYTGARRRPATAADRRLLRNWWSTSAITLEHALRAYHGLEPWRDDYDELLPDRSRCWDRFFER